jgi:hypothetical protein
MSAEYEPSARREDSTRQADYRLLNLKCGVVDLAKPVITFCIRDTRGKQNASALQAVPMRDGHQSFPCSISLAALAIENGGAIFDHGSGGIVLLRAA